MIIFSRIFQLFYYYLRPFIKWFLHRFTRLCELQRICYGEQCGANRTFQVEISLSLSRNEFIKNLINQFDVQIKHCSDAEFNNYAKRMVGTVLLVKKIKPKLHPDFPRLFNSCVDQIWGYRRLMIIIENLRITQYDTDNLEHERKLLQLWQLLMPEVELNSRITKQWQTIGFQGDDPRTDFRGMGILGLENLLYFAKEYNKEAKHVLLHSQHPQQGYTFAIVGINITSMAYKLFKTGQAKPHFYNVTKAACNIEHFHKFYCYLFFEFDRFWMQCKPKSIMDFSVIRENFETVILNMLANKNSVFKMNLVIDNI